MPAKDNPTIAYFTVVDDERTGWTGGLPWCSTVAVVPWNFNAPCRFDRRATHEILYGPTLRDHLIGEVIGPLLVNKCRMALSLLCCDQPESLTLANRINAARCVGCRSR